MNQSSFLKSLNNAVEALPRPDFESSACHFPVFIIGLPRSGTTLTYQAISKYLNIGYITNIAARFWKNPCIGIQLSKEVVGEGRENVTHCSNYGNTMSASDPHEFGNFWKRWIFSGPGGSDELLENQLREVDWRGLEKEIQCMMSILNAPIIFKQLGLGLFAKWLSAELKTAKFIILKRPKSEIAASILKCRRRRYGTDTEWFGLKPMHYQELLKKPPLEQIAEKITYLDKLLTKQVRLIPSHRYRYLEYHNLLDNPDKHLQELADFLDVEKVSSNIDLNVGKNPDEKKIFVDTVEIMYFKHLFKEV